MLPIPFALPQRAGPTTGALSPCVAIRDFQDLVSTAIRLPARRPTGAANRAEPRRERQRGQPERRSVPHGPIISLVGQGAQRRIVELPGLHRPRHPNSSRPRRRLLKPGHGGEGANVLAALQASYVGGGYTGPEFPPPRRARPNDQSRSSTATSRNHHHRDHEQVRGRPGGPVAVYSGTVRRSRTQPDRRRHGADLPGRTGRRDHDVGDEERAFTGTISQRLHRLGRSGQPVRHDAVVADVHPAAATPATKSLGDVQRDRRRPVGIYTIWVKGTREPVSHRPLLPSRSTRRRRTGLASDGSGLRSRSRRPRDRDRDDGVRTPNSNTTAFLGSQLTLEAGHSRTASCRSESAPRASPLERSTLGGDRRDVSISINGAPLEPASTHSPSARPARTRWARRSPVSSPSSSTSRPPAPRRSTSTSWGSRSSGSRTSAATPSTATPSAASTPIPTMPISAAVRWRGWCPGTSRGHGRNELRADADARRPAPGRQLRWRWNTRIRASVDAGSS